jgi:uncharacterized protein HemX
MPKFNELDDSTHSNGIVSVKSIESDNDAGLSFRSFATSYSGYENSCERSTSVSKESYVHPEVAQKEQKAVFLARMVVLVVLVAALAVVTSIMYWVVHGNERREFETQVRTQKDSR